MPTGANASVIAAHISLTAIKRLVPINFLWLHGCLSNTPLPWQPETKTAAHVLEAPSLAPVVLPPCREARGPCGAGSASHTQDQDSPDAYRDGSAFLSGCLLGRLREVSHKRRVSGPIPELVDQNLHCNQLFGD